MTALLEDTAEGGLLKIAPERATNPDLVDSVTKAAVGGTRSDAIRSAMPDLVKGAGFAKKGGNQPLTDTADITFRAHQATLDLRGAVWNGYNRKADVVKSGFNQGFLNEFGALRTALMTPSIGEQLSQIVQAIGNPDLTRSFTAGNLGIGSVYGFVPFDLLAPSRVIYPVGE